MEELGIVIERALDRRRMLAESRQLRERLSQHQRVDNIVGSSPVMRAMLTDLLRVAPSRATVLITGESGTGKELVAAAIHQHSTRSAGPFVKLHCAALAETLLESELFGHERGAFTGATARRDGRFQQADQGTLFLDEIGDISPSIQIKLLRFLQEHEFQRVGGNQTIKVDVRVVAATNRDLAARVRAGDFREDLFYRLNVVSMECPPLRARPTDVPLLAMHFLARYARENGKEVTRFSEEALDRMLRHRWPGNVRELENAVERAVVISQSDVIRPEDLPPTVSPAPQESGMPQVPGASLADLERFAILKTLEFTGGSTSRAADILGISVRKIQYKLHEYQDGPRETPKEAPKES
jgi:DNA-binding NtrC family response regulator